MIESFYLRGLFHRRTRRGTCQPIVSGAAPKNYPCSMCNKVFGSDKAMRMHEKDKHQEVIDSTIEKIHQDTEDFSKGIVFDAEAEVHSV